MDINKGIDSPLLMKISFNKLMQSYEELTKSKDNFASEKAKRIISAQEPFPVLRDGFSDATLLEKYKEQIAVLLQDTFNPVLTLNEIKTASIPFSDIIFNSSKRFENILNAAGNDFELTIKNMPDSDQYIIGCVMILGMYYGYNLDFKRPFYYEIPDANGIMRYYKILYNADFCEVIKNENAPEVSEKDFDELIDNFENIDLWKKIFPPQSYTLKGFVISNIFDVTDDQSISNIKSSLIKDNSNTNENLVEEFQTIFKSFLGMPNIEVGFSVYNKDDDTFERAHGAKINSFLLKDKELSSCSDALCQWSYERLLMQHENLIISDVKKIVKNNKKLPQHIKNLNDQNIQSAIISPIANAEGLLGVLEIVSTEKKVLNSIIANKLIDIRPFIVAAIERAKREEENFIEAIIQKECTSIHPSVHWRFVQEAKKYIYDVTLGNEPVFNKIAFENIYPLFGQIDIKGSSQARNIATQQDLTLQLNHLKSIFSKAFEIKNLPIYEQLVFQINEYLLELKEHFQVDSEQQITRFFNKDVKPVLNHLSKFKELKSELNSYEENIDSELGILYQNRKNYDDTIAMINKEMAFLLDKKQEDAQAMFPHYYERYKTDGVEHNMYIGNSLSKEDNFNKVYLYNLRLWQLQVMCEMETSFYQMQSKFPVKLDVASMILVFNQPLSISFRMDEKQFDVDGTYNARYEIVKKRVDKAYIKGTNTRVTEKGKISIIYSQKEDEIEYMKYVKFLQSKQYLDDDVEVVELQDLQAVTGLKAIRVSILYPKRDKDNTYYTYDDLMKELNA